MDNLRKLQRLNFLEYLQRRAKKRRPFSDIHEAEKRENLLAHRCVVQQDIGNALQALTFPHVIIGGHAVTFHGRPRMTDGIDILVSPRDASAAVAQLNLQQVSQLRIGGYSGLTPQGVRIDVVVLNQPWIVQAISQAIQTPYGPMVSAPFLVITKLWDSRGSQDETDVLGVLKRMTEAELDTTRQLVKQHLANDVEDLETLISMRDY